MNIMDSKNRKVLYLPSTPLNLLVSVAHAVAYSSEQTAQLVLIDQKNKDENIYFQALKSWSNSPFQHVELTLGLAKGKDKLNERKANFLTLADQLKAFPADAIAVGSDRRVEFQYLMHLRSRSSNTIEGWYLDDGLYSYAGRPSKWFKDIINSYLKKVAYGFWWQEPKTVGASKWINQAWLFSPDNAVLEVKDKICHRIPSEWFLNKGITEFLELVLRDYGVDDEVQVQLNNLDLFVLIPHPHNILKMNDYVARLECFLQKVKERGLIVAVKYHPRSKGHDFLNLIARYGVLVLPSSLAFEFVLPKLSQNSIILGGVSTVLMTAKWLRPDIKTFAILNENDHFALQFEETIKRLGISIVPEFETVFQFTKK